MLPEKVNFCPWFPSSRLGKRENLESLLVPKGFPGPGENLKRKINRRKTLWSRLRIFFWKNVFASDYPWVSH
jgi:hypothetical protein